MGASATWNRHEVREHDIAVDLDPPEGTVATDVHMAAHDRVRLAELGPVADLDFLAASV
jgi:hypothetical protein